ncbi:hypothetical protein PR002_g8833 [Phytophthora rubi]|uniref:Uncharacterized protein n=2 Tax=Phytophthora rubi TaxID=129364 RepID=A0A6A3MKA6_9STRA|nr:hypothetical protein PR002_g8833 [Phytophthora rubi]
MTHPMPEAHVSLLWDAIRQRPLYDPKRKRMTYNYKWVSAHSRDICGAHWSETAVRNVPRRLDAPAKVSGRKRKPHLQPEAILPRISSLISDAASTEMTQADLLRTVNADGGPEIKRSSFQRLLPSVRLLAETPSVRYSDPCFEDMTDLVHQIRFNSRSVVRVGAYVLTYKPLVGALLALMANTAVEVRILYDRRFCYSSADTLEAIVMLARAGAAVKHLRSYSMHIKMVKVNAGMY